jgi:ubiquinone/menaquinone biosynthesis C-methylase UbiE
VAEAPSLRQFAQVFDEVAADYDNARPGYPKELVDVAVERGALTSTSKVLEVGCGTGKLTELLLAAGLNVDAVDPGANMIEVARTRVAAPDRVRFHLGRFEDLKLPEQEFDALFSATAFHWVDPQVGWAKAASHLKDGGLLALLAYVQVNDERSEGLEEEFTALVGEHAPHIVAGWKGLKSLDQLLAGVEARRDNVSAAWDWIAFEEHGLAVEEAAELFDDVEMNALLSTEELTGEEALARLQTTSMYFRIDPARRAAFNEGHRRLYAARGGAAQFSLAQVLVTARRREAMR